MTLKELAEHNGVTKPTSYLAVKNVVFDVTGKGIFWKVPFID